MSTTSRVPEARLPAEGDPDPMHPMPGLFPLGRPYGLLSASDEACPPELVPFGLRTAVASKPAAAVMLPEHGYDRERQVGTIRGDGDAGWVALAATATHRTTHADGAGGPRTDAITDSD